MPNYFDYFYTSYKHCFNKDYIPNFGKDGAIFKRLAAIIPLEELKGLVDKFFASQDKFVQEAGYMVGVFESQKKKLRKEKPKEVIADCLTWKREVLV